MEGIGSLVILVIMIVASLVANFVKVRNDNERRRKYSEERNIEDLPEATRQLLYGDDRPARQAQVAEEDDEAVEPVPVYGRGATQAPPPPPTGRRRTPPMRDPRKQMAERRTTEDRRGVAQELQRRYEERKRAEEQRRQQIRQRLEQEAEEKRRRTAEAARQRKEQEESRRRQLQQEQARRRPPGAAPTRQPVQPGRRPVEPQRRAAPPQRPAAAQPVAHDRRPASLRDFLSGRSAVRQAIVASEVLGPPKAMRREQERLF
jgi:hypothetical protein